MVILFDRIETTETNPHDLFETSAWQPDELEALLRMTMRAIAFEEERLDMIRNSDPTAGLGSPGRTRGMSVERRGSPAGGRRKASVGADGEESEADPLGQMLMILQVCLKGVRGEECVTRPPHPDSLDSLRPSSFCLLDGVRQDVECRHVQGQQQAVSSASGCRHRAKAALEGSAPKNCQELMDAADTERDASAA